jgi:hypothetical protein
MKAITVMALSIALAAGGAAAGAEAPAAAARGAAAALAASRLDLGAMLTYALQDEQMARAEYAATIDSLGSGRPFSNIIRAEETHIAWVTALFATHGIALPAPLATSAVPPRDLAAALEAGRMAEINNIAMYDRFLSQSLPADVRQVFVQLKAASENHLRAFVGTAGRRG